MDNGNLFKSLDMISCTTVNGVLYGIAFSLYCHCAWSLYLQLQKPHPQRWTRFSLGYMSLLFLCATVYAAMGSRIIQLAYIVHDNFPGGPPGWESSFNSITSSFGVTAGVLEIIIQVLTMIIQIRRLWLIWNGTRYALAVTILPVLLLLSYLAMYTPIVASAALPSLDQIGLTVRSEGAMIIGLYTVLATFTILVTGLITIRLLLVRRQHTKAMGMSESAIPYLSIVAILVESYALDSGWSLAIALSYTLVSPSQVMFIENNSIIKVIAYFLVVYRVETGRGWTKKTEAKLTSLKWNRGPQMTTNEPSGTRSRVPATARVMVTDPLPMVYSDLAA